MKSVAIVEGGKPKAEEPISFPRPVEKTKQDPVTHTSRIYQAINQEYEHRLEDESGGDDRPIEKNAIRLKMIENLRDYISHLRKQMKK